MKQTSWSAPGKAILFGEHAVVYGRPAIAAPVTGVRAIATVRDREQPGIAIQAHDLHRTLSLGQRYSDDAARALCTTVRNALSAACVEDDPWLDISLRSEIPIARGMGSGAAISAALVRAILVHLGSEPTPGEVSALVYETERIFHGTPSGVDNTVVAFEAPVYFCQGDPPETLKVAAPLALIIADTGIPSRTADTVANVRRGWKEDSSTYEAIFDHIGELADCARSALVSGTLDRLGPLMNENHRLLQSLGVSCTALDHLVAAAIGAGASGAKLSGGGGGGCMIALVDRHSQSEVTLALERSGASKTYSAMIGQ